MPSTSCHLLVLEPGNVASATCERTLWGIIWSCLLTLFACIWVAIHPNAPSERDGSKIVVARRIGFMVCMLVVPEMVIAWALRQWLLATYYSKKFERNKSGIRWTRTHGFFLIMGGFLYYTEDHQLDVLTGEKLEDLYGRGLIGWPKVTVQQIQDHSKADFLSKFIVIIQTTWFSLQLIVRLARGLMVTQLEIATFAYAVLNFVVYILWWAKPFDVRSPIIVPGKHSPPALYQDSNSDMIEVPVPIDGVVITLKMEIIERHNDPIPSSDSGNPSIYDVSSSDGETSALILPDTSSYFNIDTPELVAPATSQPAVVDSHLEGGYVLISIEEKACTERGFWRGLRDIYDELLFTTEAEGVVVEADFRVWHIWRYPVFITRVIRIGISIAGECFFVQFVKTQVEKGDDGDISPEDIKRYLTGCWYHWTFAGSSQALAIAAVTSVFGAMHLIAWNSEFPSGGQRFLWIICSLIMTSYPAILLFLSGKPSHTVFAICLYPFARMTLIVLPLLALRDAPPGVFVNINWTSLLPHF